VFEFFAPVFKSKTQALQFGNSDFEVRELQIGVFFDNNGIKMAHIGAGFGRLFPYVTTACFHSFPQ
jgi:hypothetical protein